MIRSSRGTSGTPDSTATSVSVSASRAGAPSPSQAWKVWSVTQRKRRFARPNSPVETWYAHCEGSWQSRDCVNAGCIAPGGIERMTKQPVPQRILLVDDDPDFLVLLRAHLQKAGREVITATGGAMVLWLLESIPDVELVITDLAMPGVSGLELLEAIRDRSTRVDILVLSAGGDVPDVVRSMRLGATNFLQKRDGPRSVEREVSTILERNRATPIALDPKFLIEIPTNDEPCFMPSLVLPATAKRSPLASNAMLQMAEFMVDANVCSTAPVTGFRMSQYRADGREPARGKSDASSGSKSKFDYRCRVATDAGEPRNCGAHFAAGAISSK